MEDIVNYYKQELQRVAWRLQYKVRSTRKRECSWIEENQPHYSLLDTVDNHLLIQQLLNEIQPDIQAVNKWKRKTLHSLSQKMSS